MILGIERFGVSSLDHGRLNMLVVLVQGEVNDIAAYIGHGPEQWVVEYGDKLPLCAVDIFFPGFVTQMNERGMTYRG
jgi:hypothetical protein